MYFSKILRPPSVVSAKNGRERCSRSSKHWVKHVPAHCSLCDVTVLSPVTLAVLVGRQGGVAKVANHLLCSGWEATAASRALASRASPETTWTNGSRLAGAEK